MQRTGGSCGVLASSKASLIGAISRDTSSARCLGWR